MSTSYPVWGRRVLLVGSRQPEEDMRAAVFRAHALTVDVAHDLAEALHLCDTRAYSWVLADVRERLPGEALERRRMQAARLLEKGYSQSEVERRAELALAPASYRKRLPKAYILER